MTEPGSALWWEQEKQGGKLKREAQPGDGEMVLLGDGRVVGQAAWVLPPSLGVFQTWLGAALSHPL